MTCAASSTRIHPDQEPVGTASRIGHIAAFSSGRHRQAVALGGSRDGRTGDRRHVLHHSPLRRARPRARPGAEGDAGERAGGGTARGRRSLPIAGRRRAPLFHRCRTCVDMGAQRVSQQLAGEPELRAQSAHEHDRPDLSANGLSSTRRARCWTSALAAGQSDRHTATAWSSCPDPERSRRPQAG